MAVYKLYGSREDCHEVLKVWTCASVGYVVINFHCWGFVYVKFTSETQGSLAKLVMPKNQKVELEEIR